MIRTAFAVIALLIALAATALAGAALGRRTPVSSSLPMPYLNGGMAKQLALARCAGDLSVMVGEPPARAVLAAIDANLDFDSRVFVPLYAITLLLVTMVTASGEARVSVLAGAVLIAGAAAFDLLENRAVAATIDQLRTANTAAGAAVTAWTYAMLKWSLIAVVALATGAINFLQLGRLRWIVGLLLLVAGLSIACELLIYGVDRAAGGCIAGHQSPR